MATQKVRHYKSPKQKKELWDLYDAECCDKKFVECVYDTDEQHSCLNCKYPLVISDEGFMVCTNRCCGLLMRNMLDHGAEWRYYGADDNQNSDPTRCGLPINPLLVESSFGCKILSDPRMPYEMRKIRRYTEWQAMPYKEKSQYDEFQRIMIVSSQSGIPKMIIDDAMRYHKKISEQRTFRGLNRDGIIAASIYISCRINDYPRTAKEIAVIFNLDSTSATRGCKNATSIINTLEQSFENKNKTHYCNTTPVSFIERYCSKLGINRELTKLCLFIAKRIYEKNLIPENTPHSIAAAIVFFVSQVCMLSVSKHDINVVSDISEVTINKCYKKLELIKDDLIPTAILNKYG